MILELFVVLAALAFGCVWLGHFTNDRVYAVVGLTFLFLLGVVILTNNLEYKTGETHLYNYTPGYCYGNCTVQATLLSSSDTYTYDVLNGTSAHLFGLLLSLLSFGGVIIIFFGNFGKDERRRRNE